MVRRTAQTKVQHATPRQRKPKVKKAHRVKAKRKNVHAVGKKRAGTAAQMPAH